MNRLASPDWGKGVESPYFLYPVHVSLSFLFCPTLASSLYLLLLRLLNRNYDEVFRLASTIGTDVEYSKEEDTIFQVHLSASPMVFLFTLNRRRWDVQTVIAIQTPTLVDWKWPWSPSMLPSSVPMI